MEILEVNEQISQNEKCRTCLKSVCPRDSEIFTDLQKEMLTRCVPQIDIFKTDRICEECSENLTISYQFITRCQEAQKKIKKEIDCKKKEFNVKEFLELFQEDLKADDDLYGKFVEQSDLFPDGLFDDDDDDLDFDTIDIKPKLEPEKLQYKLARIKHDFPKLNMDVQSVSEHDYDSNIKITTSTANFKFKKHLSVIFSMPMVTDFPLPETSFDFSNPENPNKRVILLGTSTKGVVSCDNCFKEFTSIGMSIAHRKNCLGDMMKCNICDRTFFEMRQFRRHENSHKKRLCCKICKAQFTDVDELAKHKMLCMKKMECCGEKFETRTAYIKHRSLHKRQGDSCLCDICGKSFQHWESLRTHKEVHSAPQICKICNKVLKNKSAYRNHLATVHRHRQGFMCEHCGKVLSSRAKLRGHVEIHKENRTRDYECNMCGQKFYTSIALKSHIRLKHTYQGNLTFNCDKCDRAFSRGDYLKRHKARHLRAGHYEDGWVKETEDDQFLPRDRLTEKVFDVETNKYKYLPKLEICHCTICMKEFKSQLNLRMHMKTHDYRQRRFKCNYCDLRFIFKANRNRHELVHLSNKLRCRICFVKEFENMEDLEIHENSHPKKYPCHQCGEMFARKYLLGNHMSIEHMDD